MNKNKYIAVVVGIAFILLMLGGTLTKNLFNSNNQTQTENKMEENKLQVKDIVSGTGDIATAGKTVTVHYTGIFADGKKFDSSLDRGTPFTFKLGSGMVIKGWDIGIEGMKVGGKRILIIPAELAYGSQAVGPIPANSTLIFQVELLEVK